MKHAHCIIALAVFFSVSLSSAQDVYPLTSVQKASGKLAPNFSWQEDDKEISLSEFAKNKVVFLNFWATWCPPCRKEIPDIIELQKEFPDTEFVVVGVSLDRGDEAANTVAKYVRLKKIDYKMLLGNEKVQEAYGGITAIPSTFIIGKDFSIAEKLLGQKSKEEFIAAIKRAMGK